MTRWQAGERVPVATAMARLHHVPDYNSTEDLRKCITVQLLTNKPSPCSVQRDGVGLPPTTCRKRLSFVARDGVGLPPTTCRRRLSLVAPI